jgi:nucleoside phosphorylase
MSQRLTAPALLAHVFLAHGRHQAQAARDCQRTLWDEIIRRFALGQGIGGLGVPRQLSSADAVPSAGFVLLAAAECEQPAVWQATAWVADGLLGLTVMMAPDRQRDCAAAWRELEAAWAAVTEGIAPELLLGESRIFLALTETAETAETAEPGEVTRAVELVRAAAPEPSPSPWWRHWDVIPLSPPDEEHPHGAEDLLLWEIGPESGRDTRVVRRMIAVTRTEAEQAVDQFLWTSGDGAPSPLTQYLTHAARLRYQVRVFDDGAFPRQLRDDLAALVDDLAGQHGQHGQHGQPTAADQLSARLRHAHGMAIALRSRLEAMLRAVGVVSENMRLALDRPPADGGSGPLTEDRQLATWFGLRLDDEIALLAAAVESAQLARDFLGPEEPERTRETEGTQTASLAVADRPLAPRPPGPTPRRAVIFTAIGVEYTAIRDYLGGEVRPVEANGTLYEVGSVPAARGSWQLALAETGPGSTTAGLALDRAVRVFDPEIALFIGVAGGRKDVKLGDVVAADAIYDYEAGKSTLDGFQPRMRTHYPAHSLLQWARMVARENHWQQRIRPSCPQPPPASFVKPIVTGSKVIAHDAAEAALVLDRYASDALAVETEGHGFLAAAYLNTNVQALVIRGISDLLAGKDKANDDRWQPAASRHAAAFAVELLDNIGAYRF